ncbi:MAG: HNH endonuclease domain-containing protein [Salegentibacter mishustinae]|nr:HNH endonuclease domain-containing protein [Salegentibacter mishustinae]
MPTNELLQVFQNTTNSYKYYWWYSLLILLKKYPNHKIFSFEDVAIQMIVLVWYPIHYFKISFGKQDQLDKLVKKIKLIYDFPEDISETELKKELNEKRSEKEMSQILDALTRYVPFRFLRPWYPELGGIPDGAVNKRILTFQNISTNQPPYQIKNREIYFNDNWWEWIKTNILLLEKFTLFELFRYVEKNNANTPNISFKLFKPEKRKLAGPTLIWKGFLKSQPGIKTIFEKKPANLLNSFSIDHYIPWSYLTHDQLWNLHPVEQTSNSSKGNKLPHPSYSMNFCSLQYDFVQYLIEKENKKYLLDYNQFLLSSSRDFANMPKVTFQQKLKEKMEIHIETAYSMGYKNNWILE